MLPTLNIIGDVVLVEHLSPRIGKVGHGDLVLVTSPLNPNRNLIKRVVAMEGDTVTFFDASGFVSSRTVVAYGPSMLPTLNIIGDVVLVEHLSPRIGKVGHGDLVLVTSPLNPNRNLTKRVVAMEGDTVTFFDASGFVSS
ncbi:uncharacterized protein LOC131649348 [Vicia villosa]|uniref:uncharacterized protein LOC131649348 n=1 Tax=Vicia villosa TaxID=3911 RepID=UPI00273B8092|nr:uncharacterized protein LOC131649348 [Vicia villosa]